MKCPYFKDKNTKLKFNSLVILLGGLPLSDEEFESKDARMRRTGNNYSAANRAYWMWNNWNEEFIDYFIDSYVNPLSEKNIKKTLDGFDKILSEKTNEKHIIHFFKKNNSYYVNTDRFGERIYNYSYPETNETVTLNADEYIRRTFQDFLKSYNLPPYILQIDKRKITVGINKHDIAETLGFLQEYIDMQKDGIDTEEDARAKIKELEKLFDGSSTNEEKFRIAGKIQKIKCKFGIV